MQRVLAANAAGATGTPTAGSSGVGAAAAAGAQMERLLLDKKKKELMQLYGT